MPKICKCLHSHEIDLVLETIPAGIIVCDVDETILYSNPAASAMLDLPEDAEGNRTVIESGRTMIDEQGNSLAPEDQPVRRVLRTGKSVKDIICGVNLPGGKATLWLQLNANPVIEDGKISRVVVSFLNITRERIARSRLERSEKTFRQIYDKTPMGMCVTDEHGIFESMNPAYLELYGYQREEMEGKHFTMVVPEEHRQQLSELHDTFINEGAEIRGNWDVVNKQGETRSILADAALVVGSDGRLKKVTFAMDVSHEKKIEQQLKRLATTDPLTGLFNRRLFFERLGQEIQQHKRYGSLFSTLLLDVDHFKAVNDNHGHVTGDKILCQLAGHITKTVREVDIAARYGGEEFSILMPNTGIAEARAAAERLRKVVGKAVFAQGLNITVSGGVAQYDGSSVDAFISTIDSLLYRSKENGRNRISG